MKRLFIVFALVCVAALIARVETPVQGQGQGQGSGDSSEIKAGVGAVPPEITLDLAGKNRSLVYEGSYYVNGISDRLPDGSYSKWQSVAARSNSVSRALPVSFRPTNPGVSEFNQLLGELSATTDDFFVTQIGACDGAEG
jgi:hypothetical protein